MPASIAVVGFLNYFSPVYLDRAGISESTIGQVLMLFGICLALLGPRVGRLIDATENKQQLVLIGSLLGAAAFLTFGIWDGLLATTIAILLLGLSNCLVLSAQSVFLLKLDITQQLGEGKAMGIFRSTSRIGQMLGPVIFAWLFLFEDVRMGVTYLGLAYIIVALIFIWLTRRDVNQLQQIQEGTP
jgi:predicted MFS family arabinose efflux permease